MKKKMSSWSRKCKSQMALLDKSLTDLSNETNLSRTYISAIINERIVVPDDTKRIICTALEIEMPLEQAGQLG